MEQALTNFMETVEDVFQIAKQNFARWTEALLTRDPATVSELYSYNNTFLPTLSCELKSGCAQAQGYFEHFLQKHPCPKVVLDEVQELGENKYLHCGLYDFDVKDGDVPQTVSARFTFVWTRDNRDDAWYILHHHSSLLPQ